MSSEQRKEQRPIRKRSFPAIFCLSLAATTATTTTVNGFLTSSSSTSLHSLRQNPSSHGPLHQPLFVPPLATTTPNSIGQRWTPLGMVKKNLSSMPVSRTLLTLEEEVDLLRQATETRRLQQLERELALQKPQHYHHLPWRLVRAKAAGYGDEWEAYEEALRVGHLAREELVTRNMGLVQYCVNNVLKNRKNQRLNSLSRDDLVQEGAIGLARAVDKYNPSIGGKFSTYAVYWIRAAVLRCIAERDDLLRVPSHVTQAVLEINKAAKRLGIDLDNNNGRESWATTMMKSGAWKEAEEAKRLAEEAGLSERNFEEAMKVRTRRYTGGYVPFETWMQRGEQVAATSDVPILLDGATTRMSTVGEDLEESPTASLEREQFRKTLSKFLRPKEMEALSWRYGLVDTDESQVGELNPPIEQGQKQLANQYLADAETYLFGSTTTTGRAGSRSGGPFPSELPEKGRFGEAMSFNEVGKKMKVSAEYGRRLCHGGLAKLRQAAEDGRLELGLLF